MKIKIDRFLGLIVSFALLILFKGEGLAVKKVKLDLPPFPNDTTFLKTIDGPSINFANIPHLSIDPETVKLTKYLKQKASQRYYFDWKNFRRRLKDYVSYFPKKKRLHLKLAQQQMNDFPGYVSWKLSLLNLQGKVVTAYEFRHLVRQSKIPDVALSYYIQNEDAAYLTYFMDQVRSLRDAIKAKNIETNGNAVFETFRAGKRVHHWLFNHHAFLASKQYTPDDQFLLLKMFYYHAQILFRKTQHFRYGNHQTRGLVALFEIASLFPEFRQASEWRGHALKGLLWHLKHEVNEDGFQFERSSHYHKGDIENYLRVYQLAHINGIELPEAFEKRFKAMFDVLVKLAMPNGAMPVLQDDTDGGSETEADISEPLAVGAMLFSDPLFRYFGGEKIPQQFYWLLRQSQLRTYRLLPKQHPVFGSLALKETGYYVMRDGWKKNNNYMLISAGVEPRKPDHQHGDVLGIIAYASGQTVLPNYKVRYNRDDFPFLKNSWAKNVALVDSQPQGKKWQPNRGGSGFGKLLGLPTPHVDCWYSDEQVDYFCGSHNGFENLGVHYTRSILFVKHAFWIVNDYFTSETKHKYQQVWQGHFRRISHRHLLENLSNGRAFHLFQLNDAWYQIFQSHFRTHMNSIFQIVKNGDYAFNTLILPGKITLKNDTTLSFKDFEILEQHEVEFSPSLHIYFRHLVKKSGKPFLLLDVSQIQYRNQRVQFKKPLQILIKQLTGNQISLQIFGNNWQQPLAKILNKRESRQCSSVFQLKL